MTISELEETLKEEARLFLSRARFTTRAMSASISGGSASTE